MNPFVGQLGPLPGQLSATSQSPADARHTTELDLYTLDGQLGPLPGQLSATSQSPADVRHT